MSDRYLRIPAEDPESTDALDRAPKIVVELSPALGEAPEPHPRVT
jgi:hypothetical protein